MFAPTSAPLLGCLDCCTPGQLYCACLVGAVSTIPALLSILVFSPLKKSFLGGGWHDPPYFRHGKSNGAIFAKIGQSPSEFVWKQNCPYKKLKSFEKFVNFKKFYLNDSEDLIEIMKNEKNVSKKMLKLNIYNVNIKL